MKNYKICVVGGGNWGKNHIKTLSQMGFLSGVVEPDSDALNKLKMEYNNIHFFNNIDSAIKFGFDGFVVPILILSLVVTFGFFLSCLNCSGLTPLCENPS